MYSSVIWDRLNLEGRETVTSGELREHARALAKDPENAITHLVRHGYLAPLFRGLYYVRSPAEVRLGHRRYNHLELMALGLAKKGIDRWYFGLESALKLNDRTHEYFAAEAVVTDSLYRIKGIEVEGRRFIILRWKPGMLDFGLVTKGLLRFSDPEKTVLDLAYRARWNGLPDSEIVALVDEHRAGLDPGRLRRYLRRYPESLREVLARLP